MTSSVPGHALRAVRDGLTVAGLLFGVYLFVVIGPRAGTVGFDAFAYWKFSIRDPYALFEGSVGSFVYSPVIARLFAPFSALSWDTFFVLWFGLLLGTAIWLGGWRGEGWRRTGWLYALAFPPVAVELYHGNVHLLIAAAIALGFRYPATWSFVLLTKVTPGVGLLWFAVRREWRPLAIALGLTLALVVISFVAEPDLWRRWLDREVFVTLGQAPDQPQLAIPLPIRLPVAALLVIWGARADRRWTVPVSAAIALPVLWFAGFSILAAIAAVDRPELRERRVERIEATAASPAGAGAVP
jgi:Glycosyltransferase family 87